jgi:chromosomal replication initiator protein
MSVCTQLGGWLEFVEFARSRLTHTAFENWLAPIQLVSENEAELVLQVPNVFVQEYLLENYSEDLRAFVPVDHAGRAAIRFVVQAPSKKATIIESVAKEPVIAQDLIEPLYALKLNPHYTFDNFIEGASNQFVKSAAFGVAQRPGRSYNPLFIHGGVGLGKTHLLHAIGYHVQKNHKRLKVHCITTEAFINDLVDSLKNKSVDKMKKFYRSLDVLLVDDIQFLQNRLNFEEEFCNTFEALINQSKQIVITSDKSPAQLKLSDRMIARMEWGLVAQVGVPDLETRVAILQHKAELKGLKLSQSVAFFIAEHIYSNVRQLEGAINRLSAQSRLLNAEINEEMVEKTLKEMIRQPLNRKVSVEHILKAVAAVFQVRVSDLKGTARNKEVALPRQVAMYLAKEMVNEPLMILGASFGKTHSTLLHACKNIEKKLTSDEVLLRQVEMVRRHIEKEG